MEGINDINLANEKELPLVSILIPCFNSGQYVSKTLTSILEQTYDNWECILVDDGSIDNTVKIVEGYSERFPEKFKLYINPRKGACAARNFAFQKSAGEYIQFLDSDDLISPLKLQDQVNTILDKGKRYACFTKWADFEGDEQNHKEFRGIWKEQSIIRPIEFFVSKRMQEKYSTMPLVWLFHRDLFIESGGWNESVLFNQDGEFFSRLLLTSEGLVFADKSYALYRYTPNSLSRNISEDKKISSLVKSYDLTLNTLRRYEKSERVDRTIALKYQGVHFHFPHFENDLLFEKIKLLGGPYLPNFGGKSIKFLTIFLGFKYAVITKKMIDRFLRRIK